MNTRTRPAGCCRIRAVRGLTDKLRHKWVAMAQALADPTRLEIMSFIAGQDGPVCACDIVDRFELSQPTISHHLKALTNAGLLSSERSGLWKIYDVDRGGGKSLQRLADSFSK